MTHARQRRSQNRVNYSLAPLGENISFSVTPIKHQMQPSRVTTYVRQTSSICQDEQLPARDGVRGFLMAYFSIPVLRVHVNMSLKTLNHLSRGASRLLDRSIKCTCSSEKDEILLSDGPVPETPVFDEINPWLLIKNNRHRIGQFALSASSTSGVMVSASNNCSRIAASISAASSGCSRRNCLVFSRPCARFSSS